MEKQFKEKIKINEEVTNLTEVFNHLEELINTTGSNDKVEYLENNQDYGLYRTILFLLDKESKTKMTKASMDKDYADKFSTSLFDGMHLFEVLNYCINKKSLTNDEKASVKAWILTNDEELQPHLRRIFIKDYKIKVGASLFEKVYPLAFANDNPLLILNKHQVMNGKSFEYKRIDNKKVTITEKVDGARMQFYVNGDEVYGLTRQGKEKVFPEIEKSLIKVAKDMNLGHVMFDGEVLTIEQIEEDESFTLDDIRAKKQKLTTGNMNNDEENINFDFYLFDILIKDDLDKDYNERRNILNDIYNLEVDFIKKPYVFAENEIVSESDIKLIFTEIREQGMEGAMVNLTDKAYTYKTRNHNIMKLKPSSTWDLKCVGYDLSSMESKQGKVAALIMEVFDEQKDSIELVKAAGLPEIWQDEDKVKSELVGNILEIKFMETSRDKNGKFSLRHPSFVKLREDKTEPSQD